MSSDSPSNPTGPSLLSVLNSRLASSNRQHTWTRLHFVAAMRSDSTGGLDDLCGKVGAAHRKAGGTGSGAGASGGGASAGGGGGGGYVPGTVDAPTALLGGVVIVSNAAVMAFLEGPANKVLAFCEEIKNSNAFG